jgi:uncharacterized cysteine cluster protein YcgN (CxxCxxCC family)
MSETSLPPTAAAVPLAEGDPASTSGDGLPFWKAVPLAEMTDAQWESLCDGCGKCCLHKIQDEEEDGSLGEIYHTNVACRLLDLKTCQCSDYVNRWDFVPDCVKLIPSYIDKATWLPPTCAYLLIHKGKDLPEWHPLLTGDAESVHRAGISILGRAISERRCGPFEHHIVDWPDL